MLSLADTLDTGLGLRNQLSARRPLHRDVGQRPWPQSSLPGNGRYVLTLQHAARPRPGQRGPEPDRRAGLRRSGPCGHLVRPSEQNQRGRAESCPPAVSSPRGGMFPSPRGHALLPRPVTLVPGLGTGVGTRPAPALGSLRTLPTFLFVRGLSGRLQSQQQQLKRAARQLTEGAQQGGREPVPQACRRAGRPSVPLRGHPGGETPRSSILMTNKASACLGRWSEANPLNPSFETTAGWCDLWRPLS